MRVGNRVLRWMMLAIPLAGCGDGASSSTRRGPAPVAEAMQAMPTWMAARTKQWAALPWAKAEVGAVWLLRHEGEDALLIDAPGRRHDTLVRLDGVAICKPAGFGAPGDGRCPTVADAGTAPRLAWSHPENPSPNFGPPPPGADPAWVAERKEAPPRPPLPAWLEVQVLAWERQSVSHADALAVWRLQHDGATAYLVHAGCCDRYDTLYTAGGRELCSPSGGFSGAGDGKCPVPADPGTKPVLVWEHPGMQGAE